MVGVSYSPDDSHFSPSVGIPADSREGLDVFLADAGDCWTVQAITAAGAALVRELAPLMDERDAPAPGVPLFRTKLRQSAAGAREVFHGAYNHPVWQETARKCLSCGTCTAVCPTCYCFDVDDETTLGAVTGERVRRWDSCQSTGFAAVAGGESFRARRADRVRHRLSRKLAWNADDQGRPSCVGCGRCARQCTAGISIVDVMNALL
jgi:ferredoxin